ncbi:MAG: hypothetical protein JW958_05260 [Candidatus Eisenbacteria bacterium]|nr:hypothetical protein [Candidatus Eisenbacteria bacterium]
MSQANIEETLALVGSLRDLAEGRAPATGGDESQRRRLLRIVEEISDRLSHLEEPSDGEAEEGGAETNLACLAALGKTAGDVGYRLNNLLAVLATRLEIAELCARGGEGEKVLSNLGLARDYLGKIETLAVRLIDFTGHPSRPLRSDLNEIVEATVAFARLLGPYENIEFDLDLAADLAPISLDPARWQQLLLSLFDNAADAVGRRKGEGGRIRAVTANDPAGDRVVLTVQDMGRGIAPGDLPRVFDPGFTTKGSRREGLGLVSCRRIVVEAGGEIAIESAAGRGTTVTVLIPVRARNEA